MEWNALIGKKVSEVVKLLQPYRLTIITKDNNSGSKDYDTELVVRIKKIDDNTVELITSKFKIEL